MYIGQQVRIWKDNFYYYATIANFDNEWFQVRYEPNNRFTSGAFNMEYYYIQNNEIFRVN